MPDPLAIAICCHPTVGGSGVIATNLAFQLARRGHDIHIVSTALPFQLRAADASLKFHPVKLDENPACSYPSIDLAFAGRLAALAQAQRIDIIHAHYAVPYGTAAIWARAMTPDPMAPKVVVTVHGTDATFGMFGSDMNMVTAHTLASADLVTCVSDELNKKIHERFPHIAPVVIGNFVDLHAYQAISNEGEKEALQKYQDILLVHVSNFRPVKRAPDTVRILAALRKLRPARLRLIGDGPELAETIKEAERLGVREHVEVMGMCPDVRPYLLECDIFLLPSAQESFGLAALEAMACGIPVIASNVGGLRHLVINGRGGYLAPAGDITTMVEHILAIMAKPSGHLRHREWARERATAFPPDIAVQAYEDAYRAVLR